MRSKGHDILLDVKVWKKLHDHDLERAANKKLEDLRCKLNNRDKKKTKKNLD